MTGELIQFERRRDFRTGQLYRQQPVPRGPAPAVRSIVEFRVARIARLLTELEELTSLPRNAPPTTLNQARDGLEKARRIVCPWTAAHRPQREEEFDGDPQPDLDDERIERMYRELNQDA